MIGEILGITTGWDPSVCKSNRLHADILRFSFIKIGVLHSINSSKTIRKFLAVLNFNRLFRKLNRFIGNYMPVLPDFWFEFELPWLLECVKKESLESLGRLHRLWANFPNF